MWRKYSWFVAAIAIAAGGLVQGTISARWGTPADVTAAASWLESLPRTIGNWDGTDFEFSSDELTAAEVVGCLSRRYVNRLDGNTITLLIFCGRPGPISLHQPTVCFPSSGMSLEDSPTLCQITANGTTAELWRGDFVKRAAGVPFYLRTFWTWHGKGGWQVPANPRVAFAREPYLLKMYVTQEFEGSGPQPAADACQDFIRDVITELQSVLPSQTAA